jgi:hypothetical protein
MATLSLVEWIRLKIGESMPPIRLMVLLHRMKYPLALFPKKWLQKLIIYRTSLPPTEQRSFDLEFVSVLHSLSSPTSPTKLTLYSSLPSLVLSSPHDENFHSFSDSSIWQIQQNFYRSRKLFAWRDVPYEISNNNLVCSLYLQQIDRALESCPSDNPRLCVVEVGAGHGILSLLLSQQLAQVRSKLLPLPLS